jgi:hypothetical protein
VGIAPMLRLERLLPALWLGALLALALLASTAVFAMLPDKSQAGRVVGRILAGEATLSLALGLLLMALARRRSRDAVEAGVPGATQFSADFGLAAGALFCTVAGHFALLPLMDAARAGQGALSFGQLHAISVGFYALKTALVAALAWRATGLR